MVHERNGSSVPQLAHGLNERWSPAGHNRLRGQPYLQTFSSDAPEGGVVELRTGDRDNPPLVIRYNRVRNLLMPAFSCST